MISKKIITKFFGSHATVKTENSLVQSHKKVTIQICIKNANYLQPFRQIFNSLKINIKMRSRVFFSPISTQCKRNCVNISQKFIHTDSKYFCHCHTNNKHEKLIQSADLEKKFSWQKLINIKIGNVASGTPSWKKNHSKSSHHNHKNAYITKLITIFFFNKYQMRFKRKTNFTLRSV